jgi:murein DD-endopeptidase MepM/ murein hydrolase activator NlpD
MIKSMQRHFLLITLVLGSLGIGNSTTAVGKRPVSVPQWLKPYTEMLHKVDALWMSSPLIEWSIDIEHIHGFFRLPVDQKISPRQVRPPGDPRLYRNGIHQGTDIFGVEKGVQITAAASGIIMRVDKSYQEMEPKFRKEMLLMCHREWLATPGQVNTLVAGPPYGDVLDRLRGMQVWIYHGRSSAGSPIITAYSHLNGIASGLEAGQYIAAGDPIGKPGNTGTHAAVELRNNRGVHLHFTLFIGNNFWTPKTETERGHVQGKRRKRQQQKEFLKLFPFQD